MPAIFIGHGNPMNALDLNDYSRAWRHLAATLTRPRAILSISAHWYVPGTRVTVNEQPRTIHDFGGFPPALFAVQYPAAGSPALARRVHEMLAPTPVAMDSSWGLDHGTWSVLIHLFPGADVPVVQLSIDETLSARQHWNIARRLSDLREDGVLILGSGNVVHNLHAYAWGKHTVEPYDWAVRFESHVREIMHKQAFEEIVQYEQLGKDAALAAPTPDHFLPLVYVAAQHQEHDAVSFPVEGFDGGSISMLSMRVG